MATMRGAHERPRRRRLWRTMRARRYWVTVFGQGGDLALRCERCGALGPQLATGPAAIYGTADEIAELLLAFAQGHGRCHLATRADAPELPQGH